ncbi:MAG: CotH kinase family protein [Deltaproteobacteria bacterium]|nr:CotH kinase family protein [Deltaproteobacteria bacterium]
MSLVLATAAGCSGSETPTPTDAVVDAGTLDTGGDAAVDGEADAAEKGHGGTDSVGRGDGSSGDVGDPAAVDPADAIYDPTTLLQIRIELPSAEWDALRTQERDLGVLLTPVCGTEPFASSFTWFAAKVEVGGEVFEQVGVRKKGFIGSMSAVKPSLKLKFDKFVAGQDFHGVERFTLNNNRQDPSHVRQCLTYGLFRAAGIPAPRCNLAQVFVNGVSVGIYTHVEAVKRRFLERNFPSPDGYLYEGTLSDFRDGWLATFELETSPAAPDLGLLQKVAAALALPDAELLPALGALVDLDGFYSFWAMEVLVNHFDGYAGNANNYFVYADPDAAKLVFMPWGVDASLLDGTFLGPTAPKGLLARSALARRLYLHPEGRVAYWKRLAELLDAVWDAGGLLDQIDGFEALIGELAATDPLTKGAPFSFAQHLTYLRNWITARPAQLAGTLETQPNWEFPLPGPFCYAVAHELQGSFSTTWGTAAFADAHNAGTATLSGHFGELTLDGVAGGAKVGVDSQNPNRVALSVAFVPPGDPTGYVEATALIDKAEFVVGSAISLRGIFKGGGGSITSQPQGAQAPAQVGLLWGGTLTLEKVGFESGAVVQGALVSQWVEPSP